MQPDDIARVRASWTLAVTRSDALVIVFYARLFRTYPALRPLFIDVDLAGQADKLHATLDLVVRGLDDLPRLVPALERLGRMHAGLGVREEDFAAVGDAPRVGRRLRGARPRHAPRHARAGRRPGRRVGGRVGAARTGTSRVGVNARGA